MNISDIQLLFDYNYWATGRILTRAAELTPEQQTQPTSHSWNSLHGTLVHTLDSENMWRNLCQHHHLLEKRLHQTESFPTLASVASYWQGEEAAMRAYLASLSDDDMDSPVRYQTAEGARERVLWHCLVHMVNHGTQHRSECAAMLTDFGHSPGSIDMTLFLNERG